MGVDKASHRKYIRRPRKSGAERRRRDKVHQNRLVALGFNEEEVRRMSSWKVKDLLKRAAKKSTRKLFEQRIAGKQT